MGKNGVKKQPTKKNRQKDGHRREAGNTNNVAHATDGLPLPTGAVAAETSNGRPTVSDVPSLPSFQNEEEGRNKKEATNQFSDTAKESIYVRYKRSTQRVKDVLESMVPREIFSSGSVSALVDAVDYIVEHDLQVDSGLLSDLRLSIRVRKRIARDKYGGGDEGHSHFIAVLVYCWSVLAPRRKVVIPSVSEDSDIPNLSNRFEKLCTEDADEDSSDDEDDLPPTPSTRPAKSHLTLEELIAGNDRTNCCLFLMTLDRFMCLNAAMFAGLKGVYAAAQEYAYPPAATIGQVIRASVSANFTIQQVAALEEAFNKDHPQLNTVCKVLVKVICVEFVQWLTEIVSQKSRIASQFSENDAVEFLADAVECASRHPDDPSFNKDSLVPAFLEQWQLPDDNAFTLTNGDDMSVAMVFDCVYNIVRYDLNAEGEQESDGPTIFTLSSRFIGSNRSIFHTIRAVQAFSICIKAYQGRMVFPEDTWRDRQRKRPATRIQHDMDELLMGKLLPALINLCYEGILSRNQPYIDELCTGFAKIKSFVEHPERPVTWTLGFTVHTILTGIFELQGAPSEYIAKASKEAFDKFFVQVGLVEARRRTSGTQCHSVFDNHIKTFHSLRRLVHVNLEHTPEQTLQTLWNPYCAGTFLSYLAYYGNLDVGTMVIDSAGRLRLVMHLFNALKQIQAVKPEQVDMMDFIFLLLGDCSAIWKGPIPKQGQFKVRWEKAFFMPDRMMQRIATGSYRTIDPAQVSATFRQICTRESHEVGDASASTDRTTRKKRIKPQVELAMRVVKASEDMLQEEALLAANFSVLGFFVNQFYDNFIRDWGWTDVVNEHAFAVAMPVRKGLMTDEDSIFECMSVLFANRVLKPLDAGDQVVAAKCVACLEDCFNRVTTHEILWFMPRPKVTNKTKK